MERRIIIGLITNKHYLLQLKNSWKPEYIESDAAKALASWCWEYFDKNGKAPNEDIQNIFDKKVKRKKIDKSLAEEIETEILPSLSKEYERKKKKKKKNIDVLLKDTWEYFVERQLRIKDETIEALLDKGEIEQAKEYHNNFVLDEGKVDEGLDLASDEAATKVRLAVERTKQPIIQFSGALGDFWNDEMVKGNFVSILAPEKRGKTFLLMEFMMEAVYQKKKIAFIQAGDMTEDQQLTRFAIYLAKKSNKEKFCGKQYIPVLDCIKNQTDTCNRKIRACQFGVFEPERVENLRETVSYAELVEAYQANKFYKNCYNCLNWQKNKWGTVWLKEIDVGSDPLTGIEAERHFKRFFTDNNLVKLSTHANGELTIPKLKAIFESWRRIKYEPDIVLLDYMDLVTATQRMETRHQIDYIWRNFRGMTQKYNFLGISPTQADVKAHEQELLKIGNFSEDKRKLAHVNAMYGMNQGPDGREKKLGLMRFNKIVLREDGFHETDQVRIIQKLAIGQPVLGSFW